MGSEMCIRDRADIDEDDIVKKVAKASGANYSFHKEKAKAVDAPTPVVRHTVSCLYLSIHLVSFFFVFLPPYVGDSCALLQATGAMWEERLVESQSERYHVFVIILEIDLP